MSGLEILGVVASTAQLVAYVITVSSKLNEVRCQIQHAPKKLEQYDRQLKELIAITKLMAQKPPIGTEELKGYLTTIMARTKTIEEILVKFGQSSKNRRRWIIISGDLSRQLDECFKDVRDTMDNMVVLIVSQNAYSQRELWHLMVGIAATAGQTTVASTPSLCPTDSTIARLPLLCTTDSTVTTSSSTCPTNNNDIVPECPKRKLGSHLFKGITMKDNVNISMGNTSSSHGTMPSMASHVFTNFAASGNKFMHLGNTGRNSGGHTFEDGTMERNEAAILGDFDNIEQKFQHISLQQDSTRVRHDQST